MTCKDCRFFKPYYFQVGWCNRQGSPLSKIFVDDGKAGILVHITFGCNQHEQIPAVEEGTI